MSFDITDDPDPEMGAKIAELHQRRYDGDPVLTGLVGRCSSRWLRTACAGR
jgi:hypothetical protein